MIHNSLRPHLDLQSSGNGIRLDPGDGVPSDLLNLLLLLWGPHRSAEQDARGWLHGAKQRFDALDGCRGGKERRGTVAARDRSVLRSCQPVTAADW